MFLPFVPALHALRFNCKKFFFLQKCPSVIKQNVFSPQHFYFYIFSISNLHEIPIQSTSISGPAGQFNIAQHFSHSLKNLFVFGIEHLCACICIFPQLLLCY